MAHKLTITVLAFAAVTALFTCGYIEGDIDALLNRTEEPGYVGGGRF
jgi:hypothetical protein